MTPYLVFLICFVSTIPFSLEMNQKLEEELLEILDINEKPKVIEKRETSTEFLLQAYKFLQNIPEENAARNKRQIYSLLTPEDKMRIQDSDVIVSFENINKDENYLKLQFDFSDVPKIDEIIAAELRLLLWNLFDKDDVFKQFIVTAHRITDDNNMTKVASMPISSKYSGWIVLDMTPCLEYWLNSKETKHELVLTFESPNTQSPSSFDLNQLNLIPIRSYLVGFFEGQNPVKIRTPRNAIEQINATEDADDANDRCKLHRFQISFKDLEWDWIIAPDSFPSSYCQGSCRFPLKNAENATNHAILQTLVHLRHPDRYPMPKCAPDQLIPLTVLYQKHNVVLRKYKNMIAKTCRCQ